ncbi:hypothetical protein Goarm_010922 [Gossypium armourianum]|uniref:Uncharacterized protein n=1 Tax=Gossypium armourianum TaxID=34283 RepID=A0A7J9IV79_9ROSI|nr:hypothetical protein [Gossypium armourianum]
MGHLEGVTFIDSRGDGRYFISNGKDQTIKLWDTRKMSSNTSCNLGFRNYDWDYRWMDYPPQARNLKHPSDQSIATYKGHSVLRTLIRCYFSPGYRVWFEVFISLSQFLVPYIAARVRSTFTLDLMTLGFCIYDVFQSELTWCDNDDRFVGLWDGAFVVTEANEAKREREKKGV